MVHQILRVPAIHADSDIAEITLHSSSDVLLAALALNSSKLGIVREHFIETMTKAGTVGAWVSANAVVTDLEVTVETQFIALGIRNACICRQRSSTLG
jgi:hypothetical protein